MDFFQNVSVPKMPSVSVGSFGISSTVLYILLAAMIVGVVMMLLDVKIPWSSILPIPHRYSVLLKAYKFWPPSGDFTNLKVESNVGPSLADTSYSMTLESLLFNSRNYNSTEGPYRHIAHRGSNELAAASLNGFVTGCGAAANYGNLPPFGLPKRMNPGIFLDPNTNDIIVFVDTIDGSQSYRESLRVADIPLDIPFRIAIILNGKVLEVYLNCGLEATKVLKGTPRSLENVWYGLAGSAAADAQIQNLNLWTFPLTAKDIRPLCPSPPTFSKKRPICNGADKAPMPKNKPPTENPSNINLGFGVALNTCPQ